LDAVRLGNNRLTMTAFCRGRILDDALIGLQGVHPRAHDHVQDDQIDGMVPSDRPGLFPAGDGGGPLIEPLQDADRQFALPGDVIPRPGIDSPDPGTRTRGTETGFRGCRLPLVTGEIEG